MTNIDEQGPYALDAGWQILGELEVMARSGADAATHAWLSKTLAPLNLNLDLLVKILQSVQEAALHALQADFITVDSANLRLRVYVQSGQAGERQTWGFFRVEKTESMPMYTHDAAHWIELYLYQELPRIKGNGPGNQD